MAIDFTEINKLSAMLTQAGIPHTFEDCFDGKQIRMYADLTMKIELDDAIIHFGSHGVQRGLLESYCLGGCDGWETADEIFSGWVDMYRKAQPKSYCDCSIIGASGEEWEGSMPSWD
jgi:hypothetical protein